MDSFFHYFQRSLVDINFFARTVSFWKCFSSQNTVCMVMVLDAISESQNYHPTLLLPGIFWGTSYNITVDNKRVATP